MVASFGTPPRTLTGNKEPLGLHGSSGFEFNDECGMMNDEGKP
jgi:hypothetical protein